MVGGGGDGGVGDSGTSGGEGGSGGSGGENKGRRLDKTSVAGKFAKRTSIFMNVPDGPMKLRLFFFLLSRSLPSSLFAALFCSFHNSKRALLGGGIEL